VVDLGRHWRDGRRRWASPVAAERALSGWRYRQ
jgi:hypothetical protein